jgi:hypothetical protein
LKSSRNSTAKNVAYFRRPLRIFTQQIHPTREHSGKNAVKPGLLRRDEQEQRLQFLAGEESSY